jgi:hypothetical protein
VRRLAGIGSALVALGAAGVLATGVFAAPPGATARCNDATYSYSQSRSGTCSHHGGVAQWLTPSTTSSKPTAPTASSIDVGATVVLDRQTKTTGCRLGPEPDRRCSPGAYSSGLTRSVLCSSGFHTSAIRNVPVSRKHDLEVEYGMTPRGYGSTLEVDHIISLELGGSNDIGNLFPERAPGYGVKDRLENRLHQMVCAGGISLRAAQQGIARHWQALYAQVFGVPANVDR